jgi:hypothetical protein
MLSDFKWLQGASAAPCNTNATQTNNRVTRKPREWALMNNGFRIRIREDDDGYELAREGPRGAVDWLELVIEAHKGRAARAASGKPCPVLEVPFDIAETILQCARQGVHKGKGKGRPRDSYVVRLRKDAIQAFARSRKAQLRATGLPATGHNSAEEQAADDARDLARERYGLLLSANTIKRLMQNYEE